MLCLYRLTKYIILKNHVSVNEIRNNLDIESNSHKYSINNLAYGFLIHYMMLSPRPNHDYYKYVKCCSYIHSYGYHCIYEISYLNNIKELKIYIYRRRNEQISLTEHLAKEHNNIFFYVCKWESDLLREYSVKYFTSYYFDEKIKKIKSSSLLKLH